jgi:hypothetical protein
MSFRKTFVAVLGMALITLCTVPSGAAINLFGKKKSNETTPIRKPTAAQNALIDKSIVREQEVIKALRERAPLVETYIQNMRPDTTLAQTPDSDQHFLGRVDFSKVIGNDNFEAGPTAGDKPDSKRGFFKQSLSYITGISGALRLQFRESGFVRMVLIDSTGYDRQHYQFSFVRNDFLGNTPTAVFDVTPISNHGLLHGGTAGRFFGRIWIETRGGNIVRFNGNLAGTEKTIAEYYHFDSWRTNIQPNLWLPTAFYVEESDPKSETNTLKFKAISYVWGYSLKLPNQEAENTSMNVVGANDVSTEASDVSPLGAQRAWVQQAEDNVIERLYQAGLLDAPSEFDKTLETIANNILIYNNITVSRPIRVRTLLTEPLESLAIGNTIVLSKGLIDTTAVPTTDGLQQQGNLEAVLAFQLAHIVEGHRLDTKYAFNDRLLFPDTSAFQRIPMHHTDADNAEAAKEAMKLLSAKELVDHQQYFGLYLQQLQQRSKSLHALMQPMIGDGLTKGDSDNNFWMAALLPKGEKLDNANLKQQAAMPLSSFLRYDPWTDQVIQMKVAYEPLLNVRDKMPFEVTPIYLKLSYYTPPAEPGAAAGATAGNAPAAAPADTNPGPANVANPAPAAANQSAPPPAAANPDTTPQPAPAPQP